MTTSYTPREGTASARAIAYLQEHGSCNSAVLSEAIGVPQQSLNASLKAPIKHGVLVKERSEGQLIWGLGDGTAQADAEAATEGAEPSQEEFVCGLFSDGELCLMHAGRNSDTELMLTKAQTEKLINYLFRFEYSTEPGEVLPADDKVVS